MDSSEEEELALLGFALVMNDDGKKKKKESIDFGSVTFTKKEKNKEFFQIFFLNYDLVIESIFSSKFYFFIGLIFLCIYVEYFQERKEI